MLVSASRRRSRVAVDIPPATPPTITTRLATSDTPGSSAITVTVDPFVPARVVRRSTRPPNPAACPVGPRPTPTNLGGPVMSGPGPDPRTERTRARTDERRLVDLASSQLEQAGGGSWQASFCLGGRCRLESRPPWLLPAWGD